MHRPPDSVASYLASIEASLCPVMEPAEVRAVLSETEMHLRERIAALRELGSSEEGAEQEAIADFGSPSDYARGMRETYSSTPIAYDRPVTAGALALGLVYTIGTCSATYLVSVLTIWPAILILFGTGGALAMGVGAASYRSRRFVPLTLTWTSLASGIATWLAMSCVYLNLNLTGGTGYMARYEIPQLMNAWHQPETAKWYVDEVHATQAALDAGVGFQLTHNLDYFFNTAAFVFLVLFAANLIGSGLGNAVRARRGKAHA